MPAFGHQELLVWLNREFPELREELADETWAGLLHLEVACFARLTQQAIDNGDQQVLKRCFSLADDVFRMADAEVKNAMYVSYLEHLTFEDSRKNQRQWAFKLMPPALQAGFKEINDYMAELAKRQTPGHG